MSESDKRESSVGTWRAIQAQVQTLAKKAQNAKGPIKSGKPK